VREQEHTRAQAQTHAHTNKKIYTQRHTRARAHTYTHTHTQVLFCLKNMECIQALHQRTLND